MNEYPARQSLRVGMLVEVAHENETTRGYILEILSRTPTKKGVKVQLTTGVSGKVVHIVTREEVKRENFIFYNKLFHKKSLYAVYDNQQKKFWTREFSAGFSSFLFQDKEKAQAFAESMKISHLSVRAVPRNRPLSAVFNKAGATVLHIDLERKIHLTTLVTYEQRIGV